MRTVEVTAPDGTHWAVRVVWEPRWRVLARRFGGWRRKKRNGGLDAGDVVDGAARVGDIGMSGSGGGGGGGGMSLGDELAVIAVILIGFIAAAALFWWVLLPLLLLILDGLIVLILLLVSVAGRVLLRRPWLVSAVSSTGRTTTAEVIGWRRALRRRDTIADALRHGLRPEVEPVGLS